MKAITYYHYGNEDELQLEEVPIPTPKPNEILVKIKATSINLSDYEFLTGEPKYARIFGLFRPGAKILGSDTAGVVEAVGSEVTQFKVGDEVMADLFEHWGGFAEYVCAPAKEWIIKPPSLSFEEAAAMPQSGLIALQGLRYKGGFKAGQKVLINGAGGGSGTFAIQLAKLFGAEVTGVDNGSKLDTMRSLGADHVIDYTQEDFTQNGEQYDFILNLVAAHSIFDYKRSLTPNGIYSVVGGPVRSILASLFIGAWITWTSKRKMGVLGHSRNHKDLRYMIELFETGKVKPVIDQCFPLEKTAVAMQYHGEGRAKGKVIIQP